MTLAQFIYVWLMSAIVVAMPTGLVVMWALCRTPSWNTGATAETSTKV